MMPKTPELSPLKKPIRPDVLYAPRKPSPQVMTIVRSLNVNGRSVVKSHTYNTVLTIIFNERYPELIELASKSPFGNLIQKYVSIVDNQPTLIVQKEDISELSAEASNFMFRDFNRTKLLFD